ncbi:MAG: class I SAM-dependent methyltransferase [Acidobacteriota bacterium]
MNLSHSATSVPNVRSVCADARDLSKFGDKSFDLGFSNSLLEHVGAFEDQRRTASEIRRVCRGYFVQTPNFYFPIEPHFLFFPGWQFLPTGVRTDLLKRRGFGWMPRAEDESAARATVESIRLLRSRDMRTLFPDAELVREKVAGLTKSFIAIRQAA